MAMAAATRPGSSLKHRLIALVGLLGLFGAAHGEVQGMQGCDSNVRCEELQANGFTFQCRMSGPPLSEGSTPVVLLHGFPEFSVFWLPLMQKWVDDGESIRAVACDLRGYSPKAAPSNSSSYVYEKLVTDVYAIADAAGFNDFHLVGHDHGAGLGWLTAATDGRVDGQQRVISWTGMSVPHPDALSAVLYGPGAIEAQVVRPYDNSPPIFCCAVCIITEPF
jgi:pimeloyl-ACP methyl ester carboxylesterase